MDKELFAFWKRHFQAPYAFPVAFEAWKQSWEQDTDSDGRTLFSSLRTDVTRDDAGNLTGLIQYGDTAFGFDDSGEISPDVHCHVIRALCFEKTEDGRQLLRSALSRFPAGERVYAFFHYFGMSICARHGKLHESSGHIRQLLTEEGFTVEHENVYYAKDLTSHIPQRSGITLRWKEMSPGGCREFAAALQDEEVCWGQVHFLPQGDIAYLRWIYVDEQRQHTGLGTRVMEALFASLHGMGIRRFDTDTALSNEAARRYYEKTGFENKGITRSYYTK